MNIPSELPKAYGIIAPVSTIVFPSTPPAVASAVAVSTIVSVPCVMTICVSSHCRQFWTIAWRSASLMSRLSTIMIVRRCTSTRQRPSLSISATCDSLNTSRAWISSYCLSNVPPVTRMRMAMSPSVQSTSMPHSTASLLSALLARRILVLDGAMGTMVQQRGLAEADFRGARFASHPRDLKGDNDVLVLTRPDVISAIHDEYLAAGADIIETCTFNATAIAQADYGLEPLVREMNAAAARLARQAADAWTARTPQRPRFVAGAVGPTNRTLSISPDVNDASFRAVTFDQVATRTPSRFAASIEGGCHLLLIETIFDTLNAKAAILAAGDVFEETGTDLPMMLSVTITDKSGRTLSGQTVDAFWTSVAHARPLSVGVNCALGAREMRPHVAELARLADTFVSCYPNAGLPNAFGQYDEQPDETASLVREFAEAGLVNIVGGCCGTTPAHIRAMAAAVEGVAPRTVPEPAGRVHPLRRPRNAHHPAGQQLPDDWRADERDRLGAVPAPDQG